MTKKITDDQFAAIVVDQEQGLITVAAAAKKSGYSKNGYMKRRDRLNGLVDRGRQMMDKVDQSLPDTLTALVIRAEKAIDKYDNMLIALEDGKPVKGLDGDRHDILDVLNGLSSQIRGLIAAMNTAKIHIDNRSVEVTNVNVMSDEDAIAFFRKLDKEMKE